MKSRAPKGPGGKTPTRTTTVGSREMARELASADSGLRQHLGRRAGATGEPPPPGSGQPLGRDVRARMEAAFGADFSDVRINEGRHVAALGAVAYTRGTDVHFSPGRYAPTSREGLRLLGHELAHVVQQRAGKVAVPQGKGLPINVDESLEREADRAGDAVAAGRRAIVVGAAAGLQKKRMVGARTAIQGVWWIQAIREAIREAAKEVARQEGADAIKRALQKKLDVIVSGLETLLEKALQDPRIRQALQQLLRLTRVKDLAVEIVRRYIDRFTARITRELQRGWDWLRTQMPSLPQFDVAFPNPFAGLGERLRRLLDQPWLREVANAAVQTARETAREVALHLGGEFINREILRRARDVLREEAKRVTGPIREQAQRVYKEGKDAIRTVEGIPVGGIRGVIRRRVIRPAVRRARQLIGRTDTEIGDVADEIKRRGEDAAAGQEREFERRMRDRQGLDLARLYQIWTFMSEMAQTEKTPERLKLILDPIVRAGGSEVATLLLGAALGGTAPVWGTVAAAAAGAALTSYALSGAIDRVAQSVGGALDQAAEQPVLRVLITTPLRSLWATVNFVNLGVTQVTSRMPVLGGGQQSRDQAFGTFMNSADLAWGDRKERDNSAANTGPAATATAASGTATGSATTALAASGNATGSATTAAVAPVAQPANPLANVEIPEEVFALLDSILRQPLPVDPGSSDAASDAAATPAATAAVTGPSLDSASASALASAPWNRPMLDSASASAQQSSVVASDEKQRAAPATPSPLVSMLLAGTAAQRYMSFLGVPPRAATRPMPFMPTNLLGLGLAFGIDPQTGLPRFPNAQPASTSADAKANASGSGATVVPATAALPAPTAVVPSTPAPSLLVPSLPAPSLPATPALVSASPDAASLQSSSVGAIEAPGTTLAGITAPTPARDADADVNPMLMAGPARAPRGPVEAAPPARVPIALRDLGANTFVLDLDVANSGDEAAQLAALQDVFREMGAAVTFETAAPALGTSFGLDSASRANPRPRPIAPVINTPPPPPQEQRPAANNRIALQNVVYADGSTRTVSMSESGGDGAAARRPGDAPTPRPLPIARAPQRVPVAPRQTTFVGGRGASGRDEKKGADARPMSAIRTRPANQPLPPPIRLAPRPAPGANVRSFDSLRAGSAAPPRAATAPTRAPVSYTTSSGASGYAVGELKRMSARRERPRTQPRPPAAESARALVSSTAATDLRSLSSSTGDEKIATPLPRAVTAAAPPRIAPARGHVLGGSTPVGEPRKLGADRRANRRPPVRAVAASSAVVAPARDAAPRLIVPRGGQVLGGRTPAGEPRKLGADRRANRRPVPRAVAAPVAAPVVASVAARRVGGGVASGGKATRSQLFPNAPGRTRLPTDAPPRLPPAPPRRAPAPEIIPYTLRLRQRPSLDRYVDFLTDIAPVGVAGRAGLRFFVRLERELEARRALDAIDAKAPDRARRLRSVIDRWPSTRAAQDAAAELGTP